MKTRSAGRRVSGAAAGLAFLATAAAVHADHILTLHVDDDAAAGGDGLSWGAPMRDLQDALDAARQAAAVNGSLERIDILLAQGTYRPDRGTGDRSRSFAFDLEQLVRVDGGEVSVIGGYAGVTEPNPGLYDPARFATVLSGDLNGDDAAGFVNYADNSERVVHAFGGTFTSGFVTTFVRSLVLDSLTVRGGNVNGAALPGAGVYVESAGFRMYACRVVENQGRGSGVGMCLNGVEGFIRGTTIADNRAIDWQRGCGIGIFSSDYYTPCSVRVIDSTIARNTAYGGGGGIHASQAFVSVERCSIVDNASSWAGGGAFFDYDTDVVLDRTLVAGNSSLIYGGGVSLGARFRVSNSIVAANTTDLRGGGVAVLPNAQGEIVQSTISDNRAEFGSGLAAYESPLLTCRIYGTIIWGNDGSGMEEMVLVEDLGGGLLSSLASSIRGRHDAYDPMFMDPDGPDDDPLTWADNDYTPGPASYVIDWGWPVPEPGVDFFGRPRAFDHPGRSNPGGDLPACDMGAIEFWPCACDIDVDGVVGTPDLLLYLQLWFDGDERAEMTGDVPAAVDVFDLIGFLDCWFGRGAGGSCP